MHTFIRTFLFAVAVLGTCAIALPQGPAGPVPKGSLFVYWGYNRTGYSWSDLHFNGPGYGFTLRHVQAKDRPVPLDLEDYASPNSIWIPQYNYRVGWFLRDDWSLSLGLDHMKYVMVSGQTVRMDGYVEESRSLPYAGAEGSRDVELSPDLLTYEHTDGLNLLSVDLDHYDLLWHSKDERFTVHAFEGVHVGPVIPRTDVRLFGDGVNNKFHLAGYGIGAQAGLHITLFRHVFVRGIGKAGFIDLPSVLTTGTSDDRASQHFWFWQGAVVLGGQFRIGGKAHIK